MSGWDPSGVNHANEAPSPVATPYCFMRIERRYIFKARSSCTCVYVFSAGLVNVGFVLARSTCTNLACPGLLLNMTTDYGNSKDIIRMS
jgi:hypothetical protein